MEQGIFNEKSSLCAFSMIVVEEILRRSHFCDFSLFSVLQIALILFSCGFAVLKIGIDLYKKKFTVKRLIAALAGFGYIVFLFLRGQSDAFMLAWLFAVMLHDVNFERIVKVFAISVFSTLLVVFIASSAGIIGNTVIIQTDVTGQRERNGMGFIKTQNASYFLFFASLAWVYHRKEKLSWYEIITLAGLNYVVFRQSDTRNPYYLFVVLSIVSVILKLVPVLKKCQKWYVAAAIILPLLCAAVIITQGFFIPHNCSEFMRDLNNQLSNRLQFNYRGAQQYGLSFLGKPVAWYAESENGHIYNWVDSVYTYSLISYGVPFMLGFFAVTTKLALAAGKKKDTYMLIALALVAILGLWDNYCFRIECNPFYLFFAYEESVNLVGKPLEVRKDEICKKCA